MNTTTAITTRYACKAFDNDKEIPEQDLKTALALAQRAPTCFNSQAYVAVIVRKHQPENASLLEAMFATNQQRVEDAPVTIVFCGDLEPVRQVDRMAELAELQGYNKEAAQKNFTLPLSIVGTHKLLLGWFMALIKTFLMPVVGWFHPVMTAMIGESTRTWAIKQAMFPASTFMIAATAQGFATSPMEGFDSNRARIALGLPKRYLPALVISCGYPKDDGNAKPSPRFDGEEVFYDGNYATPFQGIEPAVKVATKDKKTN